MEDFEAGVKISKEWPYDTLFKLYHLYRNNCIKSYANLHYEISSYQEKNLLWNCLSPKLHLFKKVLLDKIFFTVNNWDTLLANYKRTTVSPLKLTE